MDGLFLGFCFNIGIQIYAHLGKDLEECIQCISLVDSDIYTAAVLICKLQTPVYVDIVLIYKNPWKRHVFVNE